ncbi:MAG: hypothetical protein IJX02_04915 [Clostridia bacterium]|nr:hypothetical protein [Clostridia bacterium]
MENINSYSEYIKNPLGVSFNVNIDRPEVLKAFKRLILTPPWLFLLQHRRIKGIKNAMVGAGLLRDFELKLSWQKKPVAYMRDGGEMCFSVGALLSRSATVTASVLCHELAHMWLSQQDFYKGLKEINRQFKEQYSSHADAELLSPIELYAMVVSVIFMQDVCIALEGKKKKRFKDLIEFELEKIELLKDKIIKLNI